MRTYGIYCRIIRLVAIPLVTFTAFSLSAAENPSATVTLTDTERQWLKAHPVITLAPDPDFKPIEFFDKNGNYQGAAADIILILEKKLGITITIAREKSWDDALTKFKNHEVDVLGAMVKTPSREKFALFTDTLVTVPGGIFARNGSTTNLTLKDLNGKKVAVVSNYTAHEVLKEQYPDIILDVVPDVQTGLAKASLRMVDAYVENMANATYYLQDAGITNLRLVGKTDFDYRWGIGIRKDWPELQAIMNKGLAAISDDERKQAIRHWIFIEGQQWRPGKTLIIGTVTTSLGALLLLVIYWNYTLRKVVHNRTISLQQELEERQKAEAAMKKLAGQLEEMVKERTIELQNEIGERFKSEQAAIASEKRFKELFQNVADPIYIADTSGRIIAANGQACRELGYTHDEAIKMHLADVDARANVSELFMANLQHLQKYSSTTFESSHRRKDGSIFPVELNVCLIDLAGQQAVMGVARNITKRKRTEDCLAFLAQTATVPSGEDFFHRLARYLADCLDMDFICIDILEQGNLSARTVAVFFDGEFDDNISYTLKDTPCGEVVDKKVCCYKEGVRHHFPGDAVLQNMKAESYVGTILWGSNGKQIGLIAAIGRKPLANQELAEEILQIVSVRAAAELERNIYEDERFRLEQQLLHAQKLESLGVLAGGIAHDFNNILTSIVGNADLALMKINPESPAIDNLNRIESAAAKASDLAKQMLAYSGKGRFVIENLDMNRLLEEMLHMLEVSISKKAVLRLNLTSKLPLVEADATQMRQILMNLVINASEAIGDKSGVIDIATGSMDCDKNYLKNVWLDENIEEGLYVYLEIADTGCGMDKETMDKIFDPFFTTKFTGRGLGMAAVLGIVRGHKGAINVYSEPGKGTSFKILLPASGKPDEIAKPDSYADGWKGAGKVLLVDDEETVRCIGKEMLQELGFITITANDGNEAVEIYKNTPDIAFVILDLTMPHMDGEQCFQALRQLRPDVNVIMSSGFSEYEVTRKFVGKGLAGFVQKPYKLSALKEAIQKI